MPDIWITSDTHFGHANFVQGGRIGIRSQFATVQEMDTCIIERWNATVRPNDKIYHLGDVTMERPGKDGVGKEMATLIGSLNGRKRLLLGNHDHFDVISYRAWGFEKVFASRVLQDVVLTHIPIHHSQFARFLGNCHGHTHLSPALEGPYLNVCVEQTDYRPINIDEVIIRLRMKRLENGMTYDNK